MIRAYLDHNATSPMRHEVREAVMAAWEMIGNPSSVHREGREARGAVENARRQVAGLVGAEPNNVIFTSGATEANMQALTPEMKQEYKLASASHLYVSAIEHPSVQSGGRFEQEAVTEIAVTSDGLLDLDALERALAEHDRSEGLAYISVMAVNSETGVIQPIEEIASIARSHEAYCHIDAVQAAGRIPIDIDAIGCSSVSVSAHKLGGPKGIGALVMASEGLEPSPLILGGPQEHRVRAGTENVAGIIGFGVAADCARKALDGDERGSVGALALMRDRFEQELRKLDRDVVVFGEKAPRTGNCSQFAIPGLKAETTLIQLDLGGVAVSSGSACSSGKVAASHVLMAMGFEANLASAAIRMSLGWSSKNEDIDALLAQLTKICAKNSK